MRLMNTRDEFVALAIFTALAPLAVGGQIGLLFVVGSNQAPGIALAATVILLTGVLALIVSLFHLGRPWRAPLAFLHLATSWLSREVVMFGLFLLFLACYAIFVAINKSGYLWLLFGYASAIIGFVSTFATGETYHLRSHPSWNHWLTIVTFPLSALSAGLLFGFFVAWQFAGFANVTGYSWVVTFIFLILTVVLTWLRSFRLDRSSREARKSSQLAFGPYLWLLILRVMAVLLALVLIGLGGGAQYFAWIPAFLGELADRFLFFRTAVPITLRGRYI